MRELIQGKNLFSANFAERDLNAQVVGIHMLKLTLVKNPMSVNIAKNLLYRKSTEIFMKQNIRVRNLSNVIFAKKGFQ